MGHRKLLIANIASLKAAGVDAAPPLPVAPAAPATLSPVCAAKHTASPEPSADAASRVTGATGIGQIAAGTPSSCGTPLAPILLQAAEETGSGGGGGG